MSHRTWHRRKWKRRGGTRFSSDPERLTIIPRRPDDIVIGRQLRPLLVREESVGPHEQVVGGLPGAGHVLLERIGRVVALGADLLGVLHRLALARMGRVAGNGGKFPPLLMAWRGGTPRLL